MVSVIEDGDGHAVDQRGLVPPLLDRGDRSLVELRDGLQNLNIAHLARRVDGCFQDHEALNTGRQRRGGIHRRDIVDLPGRRHVATDPDQARSS